MTTGSGSTLVTQAELQAELNRLRHAVEVLAFRCCHRLGDKDCQRVMEWMRDDRQTNPLTPLGQSQ